MKKSIHFLSLLSAFAFIFIIQGCVKDTLTSTYTSFEPVYKTKTEVLQSIKSSQPQPLSHTGKLVLYGNYIFVNEINKGVHVINNTNPSSPQNIAFINIPGNIDLALKNNMLYADIYTDMITIDINNPQNVIVKKVTNNVFPERQYSNGFIADSSRYIIDWIKHDTKEKSEINRNKNLVNTGVWMDASVYQSAGNNSSSTVTGISGSMARFTIVNNYLYTVGRASLSSFNITDAANPVYENVINPGWNIETIYPLKDKLFIGSQTGMFIYSITNPSAPSFLSNFSHACFDDPVIANDQYAFVTLRAATGISECWGAAPQRNEMDIVDISNILQPSLIKVYDMEEPKGLSLDGDHLFLCDGKGGLKVYDVSDVMHIRLIEVFSNINPFDVIAYNGVAIVVAEEGISQYDYTDISNIKKISTITVNK